MRHGLHWNSLGKTLVEKFILLQISKLLGKEPQALINLAWTDNVLMVHIGSYNVETTGLPDNVNLGANSDNTQKK
jgi:hypothetical protein